MKTGSPTSESIAALAEYYKSSDGYLKHLEAKPPGYFARYVGVIRGVTSPSDLILDVGCGFGTSTGAIRSQGRRAVGSDLSPLFLSRSRTKGMQGPLVAADAARLPFRDGSFDVVGAMEFIEHVWPVEPVLREMSRVLKPTGNIVLASPNLLSPFWPVRDLPGMLLRREFRAPHYHGFGEALSFFRTAAVATIHKLTSRRPRFVGRAPELRLADSGGDFDAVYQAHPRDIALFLRTLGFRTRFAMGPSSSFAQTLKFRTASLLGELWGSFILVASRIT